MMGKISKASMDIVDVINANKNETDQNFVNKFWFTCGKVLRLDECELLKVCPECIHTENAGHHCS